jgi:hypothetical protein
MLRHNIDGEVIIGPPVCWLTSEYLIGMEGFPWRVEIILSQRVDKQRLSIGHMATWQMTCEHEGKYSH